MHHCSLPLATRIAELYFTYLPIYAWRPIKGALANSINPNHYENMPIQIYRKFYHQKMKIFR